MQGIYEIRNTANGAIYVGQSVDTKKRMQGALNGNRHANKRLQQDWNTYGSRAFIFKHIETVYKGSRLLIREHDWLSDYEKLGANIYNKAGSSKRKKPMRKTILWRPNK